MVIYKQLFIGEWYAVPATELEYETSKSLIVLLYSNGIFMSVITLKMYY